MELLQYDQMKKTWYQIGGNNEITPDPDFQLQLHKKLQHIFHVGDFYYYIFRTNGADMEFISERAKYIWGLHHANELTIEYLYDNIHPDDKSRFIEYEHTVTEFFSKLTPEQVLRYKVSYDYRIRHTDGSYKWILQQVLTIQTDETAAVLRVLGVHTDITHLKGGDQPAGLSFIGLEGEPSFYNVSTTKTFNIPHPEIFSPREKQILQQVLKGKTSMAIAKELYISIHTVNTHRKNILKKSNCNNFPELLKKAMENGWL
ncbi:LuxR C-terminal-related transcriptional regulator [Gynurincola endophyticus]|uniref:LuxR C-terminal-related transcriptional regulator n=1 Tax=Gynurincola endophyticus TaxID=2479004 RepID=UPI0013151E02|nr:LuxR C-terminal-related transcriptional regulator [Gynurincola endophyticus]